MMGKNFSMETKFIYFFKKLQNNYPSLGLQGRKIKLQEKPAALKGEHPAHKKQ
jgi:hypothetical protein